MNERACANVAEAMCYLMKAQHIADEHKLNTHFTTDIAYRYNHATIWEFWDKGKEVECWYFDISEDGTEVMIKKAEELLEKVVKQTNEYE